MLWTSILHNNNTKRYKQIEKNNYPRNKHKKYFFVVLNKFVNFSKYIWIFSGFSYIFENSEFLRENS